MHLLIWFASLAVPRARRAGWREEWLAEIAAARSHSRLRVLALALGVPRDALSSRWTMRAREASFWQGPWLTDATQTMRGLARSPGHVIAVALSIGAGIAVCATVFSIMNAVINGALPGVQDRPRLARLSLTTDEPHRPAVPGDVSTDDYAILREGAPSLTGIAAQGYATFAVRVPGHDAVNVQGSYVSGTYFGVLGTRPMLGRLIDSGDDRRDAEPVVVLSHAFWQNVLGAPAQIVGAPIALNGRSAVVAGVTPARFEGLDLARSRVYLPLALASTWPGAPARDDRWLSVFARVRHDIDVPRIAREMAPLAGQIASERPLTRRNAAVLATHSALAPGTTSLQLGAMFLLLMAAPITVLAIACANVANLQLVRATLRARELAVRQSIGASRAQLVRLLTFEAAALVALGCLVAAGGVALLLRIAERYFPFYVDLDWRVTGFVVLVAVLVVTITGVAPGLLSTGRNAAAGLRAGGRTMAAGNSRVRRTLVAAQVALCFLLLLTAALFTRRLQTLSGEIPAGAAHTLVAELRFDMRDYSQPRRRAFLEALSRRLQADARVRAIGAASVAPLQRNRLRIWLDSDAPDRVRHVDSASVSGAYFDTAGLQLLRGRSLTDTDDRTGGVVVVDDAFVRKLQVSEPVVGSSIRVAAGDQTPGRRVTIVGVVSSAEARPQLREAEPTLYEPLTSVPDGAAIYVASPAAAGIVDDVRRAIVDIDQDLVPVALLTTEQHYIRNTGPLRLIASAATGLGTAALLLALGGLYSVIAFFVSRRTHEFGIRLAIGAGPAQIKRMVVGQAVRLTGAGLLTGGVLGVPLLLALRSAFPNMRPFDPLVIIPTALILALTALVATWIPAKRAASIEASVALRAE